MVNDEPGESEMISVEVAYALLEKQLIVPLQVPPGTNMLDAVIQSKIAEKFPDIDLENLSLGIFGKAEKKPEARILEPGDRIEIYRPLVADPKEMRKARAEKLKGSN